LTIAGNERIEETNTFVKQSQAMKRLAMIAGNEKIATMQAMIQSQMMI
jgi:hypothetical protein